MSKYGMDEGREISVSHPTLYKKTSKGQDQYWRIEVKGATIITYYGKVGGTEMTTEDTIKEGKNLGKANETTPQEQAQLEASSQWEKKLKKGYVQDIEDARKGKTIHEGGVFPMLAFPFSKQGHKIVYPAYVQPKLDGHRCIADKAALWSRTRKPISSMPHIVAELEKLSLPCILDGELYNHAYRDKFEEITHFIRQVEPAEGCEVVQYHIFDIAADGPFSERLAWMKKNLRARKGSPLVLVETKLVQDEDELMIAFEEFLEEGYEGAIVRNSNGLYVNKRSYDLQKIKEFDDAEFHIIGIEEGRRKLQGHAIFICQLPTSDGTFKVKMKGETAALKAFFDKPSLWKGKELTVQFQGYTGKNNVPRFPIGLRIREDA